MAFVRASKTVSFDREHSLSFFGFQQGIIAFLQIDHGVVEWMSVDSGESKRISGLSNPNDLSALCISPNFEHMLVQRTPNTLELYTIDLGFMVKSCEKILDGPLKILSFYFLYPHEVLIITNVGLQVWSMMQNSDENSFDVLISIATQPRAHRYHSSTRTLFVQNGTGHILPFRFHPNGEIHRLHRFELESTSSSIVKEDMLDHCVPVQLYDSLYLVHKANKITLYQVGASQASAKHYLDICGTDSRLLFSVIDNVLIIHNMEQRRTMLFDVQAGTNELFVAPSNVMLEDSSNWTYDESMVIDDFLLNMEKRELIHLELSIPDIGQAAYKASEDTSMLSFLSRRTIDVRQDAMDYIRRVICQTARISRQRIMFDYINSELLTTKLPPLESQGQQNMLLSSGTNKDKDITQLHSKRQQRALLDIPNFIIQRSFLDQGSCSSRSESPMPLLQAKCRFTMDLEMIVDIFLMTSATLSPNKLIRSLGQFCISSHAASQNASQIEAILTHTIIQHTTTRKAARQIRSLLSQGIFRPCIEIAYLCLLTEEAILQSVGADILQRLHRHEDLVRFMLPNDVIGALKYSKQHNLIKTIGAQTFLASCPDDFTFYNAWKLTGPVAAFQDRFNHLSV